MTPFSIHEQLLADCYHLGGLTASELLLNRNGALPWFILVPRTSLQDVLDLPPDQRLAVMDESAAVSGFIKEDLGYPKLNFAGLGNVVPDMHLHIIGRREGDACWPQPVWGNLPDGGVYNATEIAEWQDKLVQLAGLAPAGV